MRNCRGQQCPLHPRLLCPRACRFRRGNCPLRRTIAHYVARQNACVGRPRAVSAACSLATGPAPSSHGPDRYLAPLRSLQPSLAYATLRLFRALGALQRSASLRSRSALATLIEVAPDYCSASLISRCRRKRKRLHRLASSPVQALTERGGSFVAPAKGVRQVGKVDRGGRRRRRRGRSPVWPCAGFAVMRRRPPSPRPSSPRSPAPGRSASSGPARGRGVRAVPSLALPGRASGARDARPWGVGSGGVRAVGSGRPSRGRSNPGRFLSWLPGRAGAGVEVRRRECGAEARMRSGGREKKGQRKRARPRFARGWGCSQSQHRRLRRRIRIGASDWTGFGQKSTIRESPGGFRCELHESRVAAGGFRCELVGPRTAPGGFRCELVGGSGPISRKTV